MPAVIPVVAAVAGGLIANKGAKDAAKSAAANNQAQIEANAVDPRITDMLFGSGTKQLKPGVVPTWRDTYGFGDGQMSQTQTNPESDYDSDTGLLGRYQSLMDRPQNEGAQLYGKANDNYVGAFTAHDLEAVRGGATGLLAGNTAAPQMQAASSVAAVAGAAPQTRAASTGAAQVAAPSQNRMDLTGSYNSLINGEAGANPFLTGAIGKGINQSNNAFGAMQRDSTKNLLENVMPSIRSNSVIAGQYGGSRQGLAEGKALDTFATEQQRAMSQVGQNNTDAAVSAQAGAYDADRNRQLSATTSLGGQQYSTASQNASQLQQAYQTNAGLQQQSNLANADRTQQTSLANAGMAQQTSQYNAGLLQGANQNNQQSQQNTNALNSSNTQAGMAGLGGLLSQAGGAAGAQDQYAMGTAQNTNSLLSTYLNKNATPTQIAPVYNNSGANALGGAMAGLGLYNQFKTPPPPAYGASASAGASSGMINGMASGMGQGFNWFGS